MIRLVAAVAHVHSDGGNGGGDGDALSAGKSWTIYVCGGGSSLQGSANPHPHSREDHRQEGSGGYRWASWSHAPNRWGPILPCFPKTGLMGPRTAYFHSRGLSSRMAGVKAREEDHSAVGAWGGMRNLELVYKVGSTEKVGIC